MKKILFLLSSVMVFGVFNYFIYQKEHIKRAEDVVLLKLAPVDPRSLMQGDYMRLAYEIARTQGLKCPENTASGVMVLTLDQNKVGTFKRFYQSEVLADQELLFAYQCRRDQIVIEPDSFLFQEGHAERYQKAKYGIFKVDKNGYHMLVGLADEAFTQL